MIAETVNLNIQSILYSIFGAGAIGFVTVLVTSYRRLKSGKIVDDDTIIQRQLKEIGRKDERIDALETEVTEERSAKNRALDDVARLRRQLIEVGYSPVTSRTRKQVEADHPDD